MKGVRFPAMAVLACAIASPVAMLSASDAQRSAEQIYATRCAYCHDAGGWGTRALAKRMPEDQALLLQRSDLPAAYTKYVVRRGLRSMPAFNPSELTDAELDALADWLEERN